MTQFCPDHPFPPSVKFHTLFFRVRTSLNWCSTGDVLWTLAEYTLVIHQSLHYGKVGGHMSNIFKMKIEVR